MREPHNFVDVLVATHNAHKIPEIRENLHKEDWRYLTLRDCGISVDPEETGSTYEENARIKALSARSFEPYKAVIADDSGLEVDALGGEPGIHSARYDGVCASDQDNIVKLLGKLQDVPRERRTARFVCTILFLDAEGHECVARGVCEGHIAFAPQGTNGFGYDPIFFPDEIADGRTMAELDPSEKNSISHRGKALRNLREQLLFRSSQSQDNPVRIAAFDFDGTILEGHSPVRMIRKLAFKRIISSVVVLKTTWWGIRYKLHLPVEQASVRKHIFKGFSHFPAGEANKIMSEFYEEDLRKRIRSKAREAINTYKNEGTKVVIVSASFYPIIKEAAKDVGADHFLCTQMEVEDGYYTGTVAGEPPEGNQKLIQLARWADKAFADRGWRLVAAYGDHRSDRYLLAAAEHAVAVNPDSGLRHAQKKAGWDVVDWSFEPQ